MATTIFSQLKAEHSQLKDLLKEATSSIEKERKSIVEDIEKELIPHARGEEKTLYSKMLKNAKDQDNSDSTELVNEAYEEHMAADKIMKELKECDPADERWLGILTVLKENIEHHIEEEEEDLFPKAKLVLDANEQQEILLAYLDEKKSFMKTRPSQSQIAPRSASKSLNT